MTGPDLGRIIWWKTNGGAFPSPSPALRPWDPKGISIPSSSHQINWVPISDEEGVSHSKVSLLLQGVAIMLGPMLVLFHWFLNIIMVSPTHWAQ